MIHNFGKSYSRFDNHASGIKIREREREREREGMERFILVA